MTSIVVAVLAGFLTAKQTEQVMVLCTANSPKQDTIVFSCAMIVDKDVFRTVTSDPLPTKDISLEDLGNAWAIGVQAVMKATPVVAG